MLLSLAVFADGYSGRLTISGLAPHGNFEHPPIVHRGPYEYASPEASEDYYPQTDVRSGRPALAH